MLVHVYSTIYFGNIDRCTLVELTEARRTIKRPKLNLRYSPA